MTIGAVVAVNPATEPEMSISTEYVPSAAFVPVRYLPGA
jgi:hypothetical protein